ncbi:hypothetical protein PSHT_03363 [Puccinia striiformis]|nr:hypothetical protein PSHT_03363 [Puccinia striiformis]
MFTLSAIVGWSFFAPILGAPWPKPILAGAGADVVRAAESLKGGEQTGQSALRGADGKAATKLNDVAGVKGALPKPSPPLTLGSESHHVDSLKITGSSGSAQVISELRGTGPASPIAPTKATEEPQPQSIQPPPEGHSTDGTQASKFPKESPGGRLSTLPRTTLKDTGPSSRTSEEKEKMYNQILARFSSRFSNWAFKNQDRLIPKAGAQLKEVGHLKLNSLTSQVARLWSKGIKLKLINSGAKSAVGKAFDAAGVVYAPYTPTKKIISIQKSNRATNSDAVGQREVLAKLYNYVAKKVPKKNKFNGHPIFSTGVKPGGNSMLLEYCPRTILA